MRKRFTKATCSAIIMQSQDPDPPTVIRKLQHDLMNGPLHCFGYHTRCRADFYKAAQKKMADSTAWVMLNTLIWRLLSMAVMIHQIMCNG